MYYLIYNTNTILGGKLAVSCTRNLLYAGPNANLGGVIGLIYVVMGVMNSRSYAIAYREPYQVRKEAVLSGLSDVP